MSILLMALVGFTGGPLWTIVDHCGPVICKGYTNSAIYARDTPIFNINTGIWIAYQLFMVVLAYQKKSIKNTIIE
jgi:hypothetical protein